MVRNGQSNLYIYKTFYHTKAVAWAKSSRGQALFDGFGLAWVLRKPKPAQAKPKPRLSGQARPEQHYTPVIND